MVPKKVVWCVWFLSVPEKGDRLWCQGTVHRRPGDQISCSEALLSVTVRLCEEVGSCDSQQLGSLEQRVWQYCCIVVYVGRIFLWGGGFLRFRVLLITRFREWCETVDLVLLFEPRVVARFGTVVVEGCSSLH